MAQYNLGLVYAGPKGGLEDKVEAYRWFILAADQGGDAGAEAPGRRWRCSKRG